MAPRKKSFFELLTGAAEAQEVEEITPRPAADLTASPLKRPAAKNLPGREKTGGPAFNHEQLTPEEEGQLTIDVYQTENEIVIKSPVAGVNADDLDVNISNDMITIKGRRENDERIPEDDYYFQELYWGPFSRSVILPTEVEADKVRAMLKNGILTIRLPKVKRETIKKIEIRTE